MILCVIAHVTQPTSPTSIKVDLSTAYSSVADEGYIDTQRRIDRRDGAAPVEKVVCRK